MNRNASAKPLVRDAGRWIWLGALLVLGGVAALAFVIYQAVSMNGEPRSAVIEAAGNDRGELDARWGERWSLPPGMDEMSWEKVFFSAGR